MKILLDTNVIIHVEDHDVKPNSASTKAAYLLRVAQKAKCVCVVSGATQADVFRARAPKQARRLRQLDRYHVLEPLSDIDEMVDRLGLAYPLSPQNRCDLEILTVLDRGAADVLVTNDMKLRRRAQRIGLGASVLDVDEAIDMCSSLIAEPAELLSVKAVQPHQISLAAPIFDGLKAAYPPTDSNGGFVPWWKEKVVGGRRDVLLIGQISDPMGICVPKIEESAPHIKTGRALKLSPFKVDERFSGARLGELLLRAAIEYARSNSCQVIYLEILPQEARLIAWFTGFGFVEQRTGKTAKGEVVVAKNLFPTVPCEQVDPLSHHIEHGPGHFCSVRNFIIPVQRDFHRRLFPEAPDGPQVALPLYMQERPCGNAIRKAYISGSNTKQLQPGDGLFFLQTKTKTGSALSAIAVVEKTCRPHSSEELISFVANRSIYTAKELEEWLSGTTPPLAILFRLDRILPRPLVANNLVEHGIFQKAPQSIQRIPEEASKWLLNEIELQ